MELPGWWLLHSLFRLDNQSASYGEAETTSRMYHTNPRVVKVSVVAMQAEPEIPAIEREILYISTRLGSAYWAGSSGPEVRMDEQSLRTLSERLARLKHCALDLSAPKDDGKMEWGVSRG